MKQAGFNNECSFCLIHLRSLRGGSCNLKTQLQKFFVYYPVTKPEKAGMWTETKKIK